MTAPLVSALVLAFQAAPAKTVALKDIGLFDKKTVTVVGKVDRYEERVAKTSKRPYTVFTLSDGKFKVSVYLRNRPATKVKNGDRVRVTGVYAKEKKVGSQTFKNEIDASNDRVKTNGVKPSK